MEKRKGELIQRPPNPTGILSNAPPGFFGQHVYTNIRSPHLYLQNPARPPMNMKIVSCADLESALLSKNSLVGNKAVTKPTAKVEQHQMRTQPSIHLSSLPKPPTPLHPMTGFSSRESVNQLHSTVPPPPGFGSPGNHPMFVAPSFSSGPFIRSAGFEKRPQPQPWSPARQASSYHNATPPGCNPDKQEQSKDKKNGKRNEVKDIKINSPASSHVDMSEDKQQNDVIKKLHDLSLSLNKTQPNNSNTTNSLHQQLSLNATPPGCNPDKQENREQVSKKSKDKEKWHRDKVKDTEINSPASSQVDMKSLIKKLQSDFSAQSDLCFLTSPLAEDESKKGDTESKKKKKKKKKKKEKENSTVVSDKPNNKGSASKNEDVLYPGLFHERLLNDDGQIIGQERKTIIYASEKKSTQKKKTNNKNNDQFEAYLPKSVVLQELAEKRLIEGEFRINSKNYLESYVTDKDTGLEILILGLLDRNRALDGDYVAVKTKNEEDWIEQKNGSKMKTGKVVYILEGLHQRQTVGTLQLQTDGFTLIPRDPRFPRLKISTINVPQHVLDEFKHKKEDPKALYKGLLLSWNSPRLAYGLIVECIGKKGDVDTETTAIFAELGLIKTPISASYNPYLPNFPYVITEEEIATRLDLRKEVIFTIDPETAKDLDDAVSIKKLSEEVYEVGVHISDVTHFLKDGSPLDIEVAKRATTVYMVERAYHMLPIQLCALCSLLPGEDKLTISVIFKLDIEGNILDTHFTRSVINSCAQLSYDHAQAVLDGEEVDFPKIFNDVPVSTIKNAVLDLNRIAVNRRKKRIDSGALNIDQPKVCFSIDSDCLPTSMYIYKTKASNRLIEEFMLLANEAVARNIHYKYPEVALLRRHESPKIEMMKKIVESVQKIGIFLDASSAGALHQTLLKYGDVNIMKKTVLNHLCFKAMNRAEYFCNSDETHHYALNLDKYTHFTSPIRRYADIVVHRILTACLGYTKVPSWTADDVKKYASTSNIKKYAAKKANDMSSNFFRTMYIKSVGEVITDAVVTCVNSHSIDTKVPSMALQIRIYLDKMDFEYNEDDIGSSLTIKWPGTDTAQVLEIFSAVRISLTYSKKAENLDAKLLPPGPYEDLSTFTVVQDSPLAASKLLDTEPPSNKQTVSNSSKKKKTRNSNGKAKRGRQKRDPDSVPKEQAAVTPTEDQLAYTSLLDRLKLSSLKYQSQLSSTKEVTGVETSRHNFVYSTDHLSSHDSSSSTPPQASDLLLNHSKTLRSSRASSESSKQSPLNNDSPFTNFKKPNLSSSHTQPPEKLLTLADVESRFEEERLKRQTQLEVSETLLPRIVSNPPTVAALCRDSLSYPSEIRNPLHQSILTPPEDKLMPLPIRDPNRSPDTNRSFERKTPLDPPSVVVLPDMITPPKEGFDQASLADQFALVGEEELKVSNVSKGNLSIIEDIHVNPPNSSQVTTISSDKNNYCLNYLPTNIGNKDRTEPSRFDAIQPRDDNEDLSKNRALVSKGFWSTSLGRFFTTFATSSTEALAESTSTASRPTLDPLVEENLSTGATSTRENISQSTSDEGLRKYPDSLDG